MGVAGKAALAYHVLPMLVFVGLVAAGEYVRPPAGRSLDVSLSNNYTPTSPQQVHISLAGDDKMRISWITHIPTPSTVKYGTSQGMYNASSTGTSSSYRYIVYRSGQIHDVVIGPLEPSTTYYYKCGYDSSPEYRDLGQTVWTRSTLQHIGKSGYDVLLNPGDLAYADYYQPFWDSFGHLVEPLASQRPWMVTQGNHEVERIPVIHNERFTAYNARWHMPFEESGSKSNLFYSFDVSGVHVIMLGSYTNFELNSDQYKWLESDLRKVDRTRTPWLFVLVHAPWYNSNVAHQGEKESTRMKDTMETLLYNAHVDIVFAGHVHAYERFVIRDYNHFSPFSGRHACTKTKLINVVRSISRLEMASFGHGQLRVVNGSHAQWTWHRNDDVQPDSVWFTSLASDSGCVV
ncbi:Iron/zinc purple acid phosphatase-like C-terminal domain-containing protein [Cynara cardunculus var. scolymus]|uniref:Purple acid phosphatase n=1 Tax=Cynara cardunculus var. scolymus TaxID=59895 RepID=A0A103XGJ9_CYNCS|nr:Iron/zinc purple acid phosphatase-like C-terminal domain-containing protein [Cynara cardunculus var. scolymus]